MSRKHTYNQFDAYCKKVLRFKAITAKILQDTLDEFKMLSSDEIIEILNMDNLNDRMNVLNVEDITKSNSKIFYDLQYHIKSGEGIFVDLEPQGKYRKWNLFSNAAFIPDPEWLCGKETRKMEVSRRITVT